MFTPRTFVAALDLGSRLDILPFEIAAVSPTPDHAHEFFVSLRRLPEDRTPDQRRAAFVASRDAVALPSEDAPSEVEELRRRLVHAERQISALRGSTSWRITEPLRRAVTLLRRGG